MSQIQFTKMHGLGNDFMVLDGIKQNIDLNAQTIQRLSDRHTGVGFDQLLLIESASDADFNYRIFNADGSEVEQCGNGARCVAKFIRDNKLSTKDILQLNTKNQIIETQLLANGLVKVAMGIPKVNPIKALLPIGDEQYTLQLVDVGNPHAVLDVADVTTAPVKTIGADIATDKNFPEGINVGFRQIVSKEKINLRVYERGAGETLACGTGACAAVAAGIFQKQLAHQCI